MKRLLTLTLFFVLLLAVPGWAALPINHVFNYDQNPLNTNFTTLTGFSDWRSYAASGGYAQGTSTEAAVYWNADTFDDNQYAAFVYTPGTYATACVRVKTTATADFYYVMAVSSTSLRIGRYTTGALGSDMTITALVEGDEVKIEASGTTLTAKVNGSTIDSRTDANLTSGTTGLYAYGGSAVRSFKAGNVAAGPSSPTVSTQAVSSITKTTATGNGTITNNGGGTIDDYGVVYSLTATNASPTHGGTGCTYVQVGTDNPTIPKTITASLTGLSSDTGYSVNACAHNSAGWGDGTAVAFTTAGVPTIYSGAVTDTTPTHYYTVEAIGGTTALAYGCIKGTSASDTITEHGIVCKANEANPTTADLKFPATNLRPDWRYWGYAGYGNYSCELTGLSPSTKYYYRAYLICGGNTSYGEGGETQTFTTVTTPTGVTYYVDKDSIGGTASNSNNGTSTSTPWETLDYAIPQLAAGDTLYIRAGYYYIGHTIIGPADKIALAMGTKEKPITISGYQNEAVTITPLQDVSALTWTLVSGSVYTTTITGLPGANGLEQVSEDYKPLDGSKGSTAGSITGPGQWAQASAGGNDITLWVRCTDNANPNTHVTQAMYQLTSVIQTQGHYYEFKNLAIEGGYWPVQTKNNYIKFTGVKFRNYSGMVKVLGETLSDNLFNSEYGTFDGCQFSNCRNMALDITGGDWWTVKNCTFTGDGVTTYGDVVMLKDNCCGVNFTRNYFTRWVGGNTVSPLIYCGGQSFTVGGKNGITNECVAATISNNIVNNCPMGGFVDFMGAQICKVINNTVYNCAFTGNVIWQESPHGGNDGAGYNPDGNTVKNNIFWDCASGGNFFSDGGNCPVSNYTSDYNLIDDSPSMNYYLGFTSQTITLANTPGTLGYETHSLISTNGTTYDPKFVNGSGTFTLPHDFMLQPGSPAINAGADVSAYGVTTDYDGNARPQ